MYEYLYAQPRHKNMLRLGMRNAIYDIVILVHIHSLCICECWANAQNAHREFADRQYLQQCTNTP
jgi:hypothetical protein